MPSITHHLQSVSFALGLKPQALPVLPVFMPFAGCATRCVFCAQTAQTGCEEEDTATFAASLRARLTAYQGPVVELALYGGTFTRLDPALQAECLHAAAAYPEKIGAVRASTRPDAVEREHLAQLQAMGLGMLELGVQSFTNEALVASHRGYSGTEAYTGCQVVQQSGLKLGIQLMPGMPGLSPEAFLDDVRTALALKPDCMRLYPCVVIEGSPLAAAWREGQYSPWTTELCVDVLGQALALAWQADVPVIRIGLAPGDSLAAALLAGPWHPAMGSMVQAQALVHTVRGLIATHGGTVHKLVLPKVCQGFIGGHKGALWPVWQSLGLEPRRIVYHEGDRAELVFG